MSNLSVVILLHAGFMPNYIIQHHASPFGKSIFGQLVRLHKLPEKPFEPPGRFGYNHAFDNLKCFVKGRIKMAKPIVYSTDTCPWCTVAKDYLKENNVEFEVKNVAEDEAARAELMQKSGQLGIPVLDIDGTIIVGFDKQAISNALNIQG